MIGAIGTIVGRCLIVQVTPEKVTSRTGSRPLRLDHYERKRLL